MCRVGKAAGHKPSAQWGSGKGKRPWTSSRVESLAETLRLLTPSSPPYNSSKHLHDTYSILGPVLFTLYISSNLILVATFEVGTVIVPIFQVRELKQREMKCIKRAI